MASRTHRFGLALATLVAASACTEDKAGPDKGATTKATEAKADACKDVPELGWLAEVAKSPALLEGGGGGWVAFYQRKYRAAADKFEGAGPDAAAGRARAHVRLGLLHLRLARLTARAQADYFEARAALGDKASRLKKSAYFAAVAAIMGKDAARGDAELAEILAGKRASTGMYKSLARSWPKSCADGPRDNRAASQVAFLARCAREGKLTCPDKVGPPPNQDPWKARIALYHAALCADPGSVDEARLTELARSAADTEKLSGSGDIDAELEYFDPVAMWALGQLHLRQAVAATEGKSELAAVAAWAHAARGDAEAAKASLTAAAASKPGANALLLSDVRTGDALISRVEATLKPGAQAIGNPDAALATMRKTEAEDVAGVGCVAKGDGKKVVAELGLGPGFARDALRQAALPLLDDEKTCADGLRLLRATQDIKNLEAVSYVNEPAFLVSLAEAALCMRRSAEAIGALKTLEEAYPEAEAALAAAQGLSVVRLMGGTGGTQKIQ